MHRLVKDWWQKLCSQRYGDFAESETEYDATIPCCYEKVDIILGYIKKRIISKICVSFLLGTNKILSWSNKVQFWTSHLKSCKSYFLSHVL